MPRRIALATCMPSGPVILSFRCPSATPTASFHSSVSKQLLHQLLTLGLDRRVPK